MTKIVGTIDEYGFPNIPDVIIGNPFNGTGTKPPKSVIDTGAADLYIKPIMIDLLQLKKIDEAFTLHPLLGKQPVNIYHAFISIQEIDFGLVQVKPILSDFPFDVIIGCSFIKNKKMVYDGVGNTVEIII
jgi:hypothetical protein